MTFLKAFGKFWYDFIIGDDWKIAVAVVVALALLLGAMNLQLLGDGALALLGAVLLVAGFATSLAIDVRPKRGR